MSEAADKPKTGAMTRTQLILGAALVAVFVVTVFVGVMITNHSTRYDTCVRAASSFTPMPPMTADDVARKARASCAKLAK
ncbi:MAG: hypothetical protein ACREEB_13700 [Caulobacteraceae bacterium]